MNKGIKYKLYTINNELSDVIIAHYWQINNTHHAFYDEDSKLFSVWPIANTVVEVVDLYDKMNEKMKNQSANNDNSNKINQTIEKL